MTSAPTENTDNNPLGSVPINILLARFAIPSIIAMLVSALYNIVDQFFIGRSVGMLGNAATNVAFPLTITCTAVSLMCGIGGSANFNLAMGRGEKEEARHYSLTYTGITSLGFPFLILATGGSNLVRADGSPRYSMVCTLAGAVINTILDPLFIFGFHMGMAGAALATIIGQIVSGLMVIGYLTRFKTVYLSLRSLRPLPSHIKAIAALGMAPFFNQMAMMVIQIVMNNTLRYYGAQSHYGSEIPLACAGIITKVNMIFFSLVIGLSQGLQPIVSYNYGAGNYERVREAYLKAVCIATAISTFSFLCFQLVPRQIIGIFGSGSEEYFHFAEQYFRIFLFFTFLNGLQPITANFFTSIGKAAKGIFISLTRQIIFLLPLIIILPLIFGIEGVMYSAPVADLMAAALAALFVVRELSQMKQLQQAEG